MAPVGVSATDDSETILALDADCVNYNALGAESNNDALGDITRILASGKNVVSSAGADYAYVRPDVSIDPDGHRKLVEACHQGETSFYMGGINPGFAMDQWPIALSRLCRRIERMHVTEIVDCRGYDSSLMQGTMGFGLPPEAESPLDRHLSNVTNTTFYLSLRMLADAIGLKLDDVKYSREAATTDVPLDGVVGRYEPGTIVAQRLRIDGIVDGEPRLSLFWVWRLTDDVAPEWPRSGFKWLFKVEGDPDIDSEIELDTATDAGRPTSLTTAALLINALPAVCDAQPGLIDNLTLAPHSGRAL
ncbi:hypothetical protein [Mycolicibacterium vanbaalenii]|nr:hypothetical protein [Mycolicibacterium vanbaalenii]